MTQNEDAFRALATAPTTSTADRGQVTQKAGATIDLDLEALLAFHALSAGWWVGAPSVRRAHRVAPLRPEALGAFASAEEHEPDQRRDDREDEQPLKTAIASQIATKTTVLAR